MRYQQTLSHTEELISPTYEIVIVAMSYGWDAKSSVGDNNISWSFDVFFDLRLNKRLSKQSWGWWFETPSHPLWRHCNEFSWSYGLQTFFRICWNSKLFFINLSIPISITKISFRVNDFVIGHWLKEIHHNRVYILLVYIGAFLYRLIT